MLLYEPPASERGDPGDPNCKKCHGRGVVEAEEDTEKELGAMPHPPAYRRCSCVLHMDILSNVERGMKGLTKAARVKKSALVKYATDNLWITAEQRWFAAHLRHVAVRKPPSWYFRVVSDVDLMTAWLASAALKGKDILDPDAATVSLTHLTLVDLVQPPALLIIRTGVKAARNVAAPEVLYEALSHRAHLDMPTWVWDQPYAPLDEGHLCYSPAVGEFLEDWKHIAPRQSSTARPSSQIERVDPEGFFNPDDGEVPLGVKKPRKRRTLSEQGGDS
jgi:hypothetical protein